MKGDGKVERGCGIKVGREIVEFLNGINLCLVSVRNIDKGNGNVVNLN